MDFTPKIVAEKYQKNELDRVSAIELLISFLENSENEDIRVDSIQSLKKINGFDIKIFKLLENLLISDDSWRVRHEAIIFIIEKFKDKSISILKWAVNYEQEYNCSSTIVKALVKINTAESKSILITQIKKISKKKYLFDDKKTTNRAFRKDIKNLLKTRDFEDFTHQELAAIFINFKTILALKQKFYSVYYELEDALVTTLDLSDVEFEVRGWKSEFKNEIKNLSEIPGLTDLANLKCLYLSNNEISDIQELTELKNLTELYISKNRLNDPKNLEYIKEMKSLKFLDISENGICDTINKKDFNYTVRTRRTGATYY